MTVIYGYAIRHPWRVIALATLLVGAVSPGLGRLRLRTDGNALVPEHAEEVARDHAIRLRFGFHDQTIVVVDTGVPDGIYEAGPLRTFAELAARISSIDGLTPHEVTSVLTEKIDHVYPRTIRFRTLLEPFPDAPERMAEFRSDIETVKIYSGTLVSGDASALAILINTPRRVDRAKLQRDIDAAIRDLGSVPEKIYVAGAPVAESQLGIHILDDLLGSRVLRWLAECDIIEPVGEAFDPESAKQVSLILVVFAVMAVVFLVVFRSLPAVVLPLGEVGACLVFTFSVMGWAGVPVYLTIAVLPVILTAIGVADELHIFVRYTRAVRDDPDCAHPGPLRLTMDEMWRPVLKTSVTSAVGFLSFSLSPIPPVKWFGVFMALGIVFCLVWSLTVIPACLSLTARRRFGNASGRGGGTLAAFDWLGRAVIRRRYVCLMGIAALVALAPMGVSRVVIQDSWVDAFAPQSALHQATRRVNDAFYGAHLLLIEVDTGPELGRLESPAVLKLVRDLETFVEGLGELTVGGVQGYNKAVTTAHFLVSNRKFRLGTPPRDEYRTQRALLWYGKFRGKERLRQLIDTDSRRCLSTVFLKDANFVAVSELLRRIREYEREHLAPHSMGLTFGGDVAVSQAMIGGIVETQTQSLLLSLVGIVVVASLLSRSITWGVLCVLPAAIAVLMNFAVMGFVGMPLGVATSMFSGMTIGIGVDYAIHLLERARLRAARGDDIPTAIVDAVAHTGPAIVVDAIAIALAFGVLALSHVPANGRLGGLVVLAVVTCLTATCVLLPALLRVIQPRFLRSRPAVGNCPASGFERG